MAADNIVSLTRRKAGPDGELAPSSATGEARLRELENLIKTAATVQAQAEAELSQTEATQSVAQQRKAAADSVRRKAEAEMARLRAELARQKPLWAPGDPVPQAKQREDFEIRTMVGSASRGRFSDSAFQDSDLALNEEDNRVDTRMNTAPAGQNRTAKARSAAHHYHRSSRRGWAVALFMLIGITSGAGITWLGIQHPDTIGSQIAAISASVSTLIAGPEKEPTPAQQLQTTAAPGAQPQPAAQRALETAAWQQAIAQQKQRVRDAAASRFKERTR